MGEIAARPEGVEEILSHPHLRVRVYFEFLGVSEGRARERFAEARRRALDLAAAAAALGLDRVRPGLSPHAPYSVWPTQWREAADFARDHDLFWTSHVAEPPEEEEFLRQGTGPLRDYLIGLGVWDGAFPIPGRPAIEMLAEEGALGPRALLVHAIHLEPGAMARVARSGASVCLCPRSNAFLGLPPAPVEALENAGVQLCLGTDAKASNEDLSVWAEMRALAGLAPGIPAQRILEMATTAGARALGFEGLAGTIRIGDRSPLVAVRMEAEDGDPIRALLAEGVEDALLPL